MQFAQINIVNEAPPTNIWEVILPALLGLVGVVVGAAVTNAGQRRRDLQQSAEAVRSASLNTVSAITHYLGLVSSLIELGKIEDTPRKSIDEIRNSLNEAHQSALREAALLTGAIDEEIAKQGALLHANLAALGSELIPVVRRAQFAQAATIFARHSLILEREYNVLLFMIQAEDRLLSGKWFGAPFFRSRSQGATQYDHLK